jgi:hypothetical protein
MKISKYHFSSQERFALSLEQRGFCNQVFDIRSWGLAAFHVRLNNAIQA